jgi:hypothetical protein
MAKYTATSASTLCNTAEEAVTALTTMVHLVDTGKYWISKGITETEDHKFLAWINYTAEA